ncbi:hypothetical protein NKV53_10780 [Legionella sp. 27cVA30]|uniref:capsular polysaccharide export protein, LipB/KpsS family n=1 Tax=Legionella sp. 27cVA30 TaxID=2905657 RepID=UPI00209C7FC6|nr:hypothetical protein [Legionella sp. 27cVA30]
MPLEKPKISLFITHLSSARAYNLALKFAAKNNIHAYFLRRGFIGHPQYPKAYAAFLEEKIVVGEKKLHKHYLYNQIKNLEIDAGTLKQAHLLRKLYIALKLGYSYNPTLINTKKFLGPKLKKRILIIPARKNNFYYFWQKPVGLLTQAIEENPDAEFLYYDDKKKPSHDLIYKKININGKVYQYRIITKAISLTEVINLSDHIYTKNALNAIDAIFYEKQLTVTGTPFYSGWGLTDDRSSNLKSRGSLSVDQLFALLFLKCTRYSIIHEDSASGLLATMFEILGYSELCALKTLEKTLVPNRNLLSLLCESEYWPIIFDLLKSKKLTKHDLQLIKNHLNFSSDYIFGKKANYALASAIIGLVANNQNYFTPLITALKRKVPSEDIIGVLQKGLKLGESDATIMEIAQILAQGREWEKSYELLEHLMDFYQKKSTLHNAEEEINPIAQKRLDTSLARETYETEYNAAKALIALKRYAEAEEIFYKLLLSGLVTREVFFQLAEIAKATFHFHDAINLYKILFRFEKLGNHNAAQIAQASVSYFIGDGINIIRSLSIAIKKDPSAFSQILLNKDILETQFGDCFAYDRAFFYASQQRLSHEEKTELMHLGVAKAYMVMGKADEQVKILKQIKYPAQTLPYYLALASACTLSGQYQEARKILEELIIHFPSLRVYQEAVKLAIRMDEYQWAKELFAQAEACNIKRFGVPVDEILLRKYNFATNNIYEAYRSYRDHIRCATLKLVLGNKYIQSSNGCTAKSILVLAFFGPGDEIRFSALYPQMSNLFPNKKVTFTCEPRLYELYVNSYPDLDFLPVPRQRKLSYKLDLNQYNKLPTLELHDLFDNQAWLIAQEYEAITLACDLLGDIIKDKHSISGKPFLSPSLPLKQKWLKKVPTNTINIGISWRSSLVTYARDEHYLTIEDLQPLFAAFANTNVQFFNFQYDDSEAEIAWVEKNCNAKIVNYTDLDQYNDLSSVAALMSCMDLMIAPATTVVELAGSLGCKTFLLSNSSELHWRKLDENEKTDVWYHNVNHIEGDYIGNKKTLVLNLIKAINNFITSTEENSSKFLPSSELTINS